jgi:tRNA threonylcarbamoyladenosine biosynthesis protein TsaB
MRILALETSNSYASVAVSEGQNILAYFEDLRPAMQAETLLPMIEKALAYSLIDYKQIDCLAATVGPGSFTGIRIGLAAASGISIGLRNKVETLQEIGVTNFEMAFFRACAQVSKYDHIVVLLNAFRGQLYVQSFSDIDSRSPVYLMDYEEALVFLNQKTGKIICTGSGCNYLPTEKLSTHILVLPRFVRIKAIDICKYIYFHKERQNIQPLIPFYVRQPDAKIKATSKN